MVDAPTSTLIQALGPPLYRYFLTRFRPALAEELVQETFARLSQSASFATDRGSMEAFAWGIAQNVQRESLRKEARHPLTHLTAVEGSTDDGNERGDDIALLRRAVSLLGEPERSVLQFVLADCDIKDIAGAMSMPAGTVKSHIHRGKENIKDQFRKWGLL